MVTTVEIDNLCSSLYTYLSLIQKPGHSRDVKMDKLFPLSNENVTGLMASGYNRAVASIMFLGSVLFIVQRDAKVRLTNFI